VLHSNRLHVSVHQIHHRAPLLQTFKYMGTLCNRNSDSSLTEKLHIAKCTCIFKVCNKMPDGGSDALKHVASCCVTLQCCVWLRTEFVFQYDFILCLNFVTGCLETFQT
jgi:hypothetical protein